MLIAVLDACQSRFGCIKYKIKRMTRPASATVAAGALLNWHRNKSELSVENALLRHQMVVLNRTVKRVMCKNPDHGLFSGAMVGRCFSAVLCYNPASLPMKQDAVMLWFLTGPVSLILLAFIRAARLSASDKNLEVIFLRHQLGVMVRKP